MHVWEVEELETDAFLVMDGKRVARLSKARAYGIARALNGPFGNAGFELGRQEFLSKKV